MLIPWRVVVHDFVSCWGWVQDYPSTELLLFVSLPVGDWNGSTEPREYDPKCPCPVYWTPRKMIMSYHEARNMGINISWGFAIIIIVRWVQVDFSVITRIQKYDSFRNHCRSSLSSFWGLHPRSGLLTRLPLPGTFLGTIKQGTEPCIWGWNSSGRSFPAVSI